MNDNYLIAVKAAHDIADHYPDQFRIGQDIGYIRERIQKAITDATDVTQDVWRKLQAPLLPYPTNSPEAVEIMQRRMAEWIAQLSTTPPLRIKKTAFSATDYATVVVDDPRTCSICQQPIRNGGRCGCTTW